MVNRAGPGIALRIVGRSVHETLGVMSVVKSPVIDTSSGYPVMEGFGMVHHQKGRHRPAE